jgi:hypothetical protein
MVRRSSAHTSRMATHVLGRLHDHERQSRQHTPRRCLAGVPRTGGAMPARPHLVGEKTSMKPPTGNYTLDAFTRVAAWYLANPPATWYVARHPSGWHVMARDGTYISAHRTRREATANLTDGPNARAHYATLDWYLGYSRGPRLRQLTDAEREAVAQLLSSTTSATPMRRLQQLRAAYAKR